MRGTVEQVFLLLCSGTLLEMIGARQFPVAASSGSLMACCHASHMACMSPPACAVNLCHKRRSALGTYVVIKWLSTPLQMFTPKPKTRRNIRGVPFGEHGSMVCVNSPGSIKAVSCRMTERLRGKTLSTITRQERMPSPTKALQSKICATRGININREALWHCNTTPREA